MRIQQYIDFDFSDKYEFDDFFSNLLNEVGKIISIIAKISPTIGLDLVISVSLSDQTIPTIAQFLTFYVRSIDVERMNEAEFVQKTLSLIKMGMDFSASNMTLLVLKFDLLKSFLPFFPTHVEAAISVFQFVGDL